MFGKWIVVMVTQNCEYTKTTQEANYALLPTLGLAVDFGPGSEISVCTPSGCESSRHSDALGQASYTHPTDSFLPLQLHFLLPSHSPRGLLGTPLSPSGLPMPQPLHQATCPFQNPAPCSPLPGTSLRRTPLTSHRPFACVKTAHCFNLISAT